MPLNGERDPSWRIMCVRTWREPRPIDGDAAAVPPRPAVVEVAVAVAVVQPEAVAMPDDDVDASVCRRIRTMSRGCVVDMLSAPAAAPACMHMMT